ncbi:MAG: DNA polymerase III subunit delta [Legionellaceae bacterium]|nr:DNA polymerase III subunit delta [Legionellaceae bacterium]
MLIQYPGLAQQLQRGLSSLYILTGQEEFLMDRATQDIKAAWRDMASQAEDTDGLDWQYRELQGSAKDWESLTQDLSSRSLFSTQSFYHVRYSKKTLDKNGQTCLQTLTQTKAFPHILLLQAPFLKAKEVATFQKKPNVLVLSLYPLQEREFHQWIYRELQRIFPSAQPTMAALIGQYTQGNLFAADQVIKKLVLILAKDEPLSIALIQNQLHQQTEFQAFELSDACLSGNAAKALQILRQLGIQMSQIPLLLWILGNDIRQLMRLHFHTRTQSWRDACQALKIWPAKYTLYQKAVQRLDAAALLQLHNQCLWADSCLKSGQTSALKQTLEQIALGLCHPQKLQQYV